MKTLGAKLDRKLWKIPKHIPGHEQTRTVVTQDSRLRIRDSGGTGKALVFLCDPPVTVEAYDELISSFQADYRIIVMELPGFGFSHTSNADQLAFQGAVESVEAAIGQLELGPVVIFGPCVCGFVAAEIAARGVVPLSGLVLMQTPDKKGMLSWVERMDPKGLLRVPILGQLMIKLNAMKVVRFWLKYATAKSFDEFHMVEATEGALKRGGGYPLATMLQLWSDGPRDTQLEVPGLIIWGNQDKSHKHTDVECTKAHLKQGEIIEFADCGHFSELENPQGFANAVKPFLKRCFGEIDNE